MAWMEKYPKKEKNNQTRIPNCWDERMSNPHCVLSYWTSTYKTKVPLSVKTQVGLRQIQFVMPVFYIFYLLNPSSCWVNGIYCHWGSNIHTLKHKPAGPNQRNVKFCFILGLNIRTKSNSGCTSFGPHMSKTDPSYPTCIKHIFIHCKVHGGKL